MRYSTSRRPGVLCGAIVVISFSTFPTIGQDFSLEIDRLIYSDGNGLTVDHGFNVSAQDPAPNQYIIPSSDVSATDPFWDSASIYWGGAGELAEQLSNSLTGDSFRMALAHPTIAEPEPSGLSAMGSFSLGPVPPASDTWSAQVRLNDFANVGRPQVFHDFGIGSGQFGDRSTLNLGGTWFTGTFGGVDYDNVLALTMEATVIEGGIEVHQWESHPDGLPLLLFGLDPATVQLDLRIAVTGGTMLAGQYRVNSDDPADWNTVAEHTLPAGLPPATGYFGHVPLVELLADFATTPGDADFNNAVDANDLQTLAANWQAAGAWVDGDFNGDGLINLIDLGLLASTWMTGVPAAQRVDLDDALVANGLSLPEPTALSTLGIGAMLLVRSRKLRRNGAGAGHGEPPARTAARRDSRVKQSSGG